MTNTITRMLNYLPAYYQDSLQALLQPQGQEVDSLTYALDGVLNQLFIETATWGLPYWEDQYGLPVNENLPDEIRRKQILAQKRGDQTNLVAALNAVEPALKLYWGKLILPFVIESNTDIYDFGPLIVIVERLKPAHLGYTFTLLPDHAQSGYTIYAHHKNREAVNLELRTGSARAGRWPRRHSPGKTKQTLLTVGTVPVTGDSIFILSGMYTSGHIYGQSKG